MTEDQAICTQPKSCILLNTSLELKYQVHAQLHLFRFFLPYALFMVNLLLNAESENAEKK